MTARIIFNFIHPHFVSLYVSLFTVIEDKNNKQMTISRINRTFIPKYFCCSDKYWIESLELQSPIARFHVS